MMCEIRYHTYRTADRNKDIGIKVPANYNMESCRIAKSLDENIMQKKFALLGKKIVLLLKFSASMTFYPLFK